jgi:hypothetical protein
MRKGHRVEKESITLLAVAFLAGFAPLGAFPAPANALGGNRHGERTGSDGTRHVPGCE